MELIFNPSNNLNTTGKTSFKFHGDFWNIKMRGVIMDYKVMPILA